MAPAYVHLLEHARQEALWGQDIFDLFPTNKLEGVWRRILLSAVLSRIKIGAAQVFPTHANGTLEFISFRESIFVEESKWQPMHTALTLDGMKLVRIPAAILDELSEKVTVQFRPCEVRHRGKTEGL